MWLPYPGDLLLRFYWTIFSTFLNIVINFTVLPLLDNTGELPVLLGNKRSSLLHQNLNQAIQKDLKASSCQMVASGKRELHKYTQKCKLLGTVYLCMYLPPRPANSNSNTGDANLSAKANRYSWTNADTKIEANTATKGLWNTWIPQ